MTEREIVREMCGSKSPTINALLVFSAAATRKINNQVFKRTKP